MKKIISFLLLVLIARTSNLIAQTIKLEIQNLHVKVKDMDYTAQDGFVDLKLNGTTDEKVLISNENVEVRAAYKLNDFEGSRRSNMKNTSIKLTVYYVFIYGSKTIKRKVERFYYLDDTRTIEEKEKAVFKQGISNTIVEISYKGKLPQ